MLNGSKLFQEEKFCHLNIAKVYFWNYIFFSYRQSRVSKYTYVQKEPRRRKLLDSWSGRKVAKLSWPLRQRVKDLRTLSSSTFLIKILLKAFKQPLRFRKAGRVWCGGALETHWATCHNEVTASKTKEFLKSFCFLDHNGIKF